MEKVTQIKQLTLKVFFLIVANDLLDTSAQLLIKKGVPYFLDFTHPDFYLFWLGVAIYLSNFFLWMKILSKVELSVALPLASSSYILIPLAAIFFLHEFVSPLRWLGLVLIMLGIYFVSGSRPGGRCGNNKETLGT